MTGQTALSGAKRLADDKNSFLQGENNHPASLKAYLLEKGLPLGRSFRCLSPDHEDKRPSMSYDAKRDKAHCFACGATYDLVDALVQDGVPLAEAMKAKYGGRIRDRRISARRAPAKFSFTGKKNYLQGKKINDSAGLAYWASRGFTREAVERFGLSADERCALIPFGEGYVQRRSLCGKRFYNPKGLPTRIYDPECATGLVVVTEGAIDAMSVLQAASGLSGARVCAVGLNSVANVGLLALNARPGSVYCLALDNDEAGAEAARKLAGLLESRGQAYFMAGDLYGGYKDANEALCADAAAFTRAIARVQARYEALLAALPDEKDCAGHVVYDVRDVQQVQDVHSAQYTHDAQGAHVVYDTHNAQDVQAVRVVYDTHDVQANPLPSNAEFLDGLFLETEAASIKTGFGALDGMTGGIPAKGLTVLGAPSAAGKTTFCLQIADDIARRGMDVLFFTLEVSRRSLTLKSLSRETAQSMAGARGAAVPVSDIAARKDEPAVRAAMSAYAEYAGRIYMIEPKETPTPALIERAVRGHIERTGRVPFVVVDYLQLLRPDEAYMRARVTDKQALDRAVETLKRLCRAYGVTVLAVSSLNRQAYHAADIAMESFKESGAIEYSGDMLLGMKASGSPGEIAVSVIKNRFGPAGMAVKLKYHAAFGCFEPLKNVRN